MARAYARGTSARSWNPDTMLHRLTEHQRHLEAAANRPTLTHQQRATAAEASEAVAWAITRIRGTHP